MYNCVEYYIVLHILTHVLHTCRAHESTHILT